MLDRDGTLIEERHYLSQPDQVVLIPDADQALRSLVEENIGIVLLTNQSGLARGFFDWNGLKAIHAVLEGLLEKAAVTLDGIYVCPHLPEANCDCRKPKTGLALAAAADLEFKLPECIVVGDKICDIELGKKISAKTILVATGHGKEQSEKTKQMADLSVPSLVEACQSILEWKRNTKLSLQKDIRYG